MKGYRIAHDPNVEWNLYTDDPVGFCMSNGEYIAQVLNSVRDIFIDVFGADIVNAHPVLTVLPSCTGPVTYRENYLIFLSSGGDFYLQHIYQFSHELCHFMVPDEVCGAYRWFEETICEAMSWYALKRIYDLRNERPSPVLNSSIYNDIKSYITLVQNERISFEGVSLSAFIAKKLPYLQKNCYDRKVNAAIAYELYPLFSQHPQLWKIVPFLNQLNDGMELSSAISHLLSFAHVEEIGGNKFRQRLCE